MPIKNAVLAGSTGLLALAAVLVAPAPAIAADTLTPRTPGPLSVVYKEEAVIAATPERIWDVLVDLPRYGEWNPWLPHAEGVMQPGGVVHVDVLLNGSVMKAEHVVLVVEPSVRFCWRDSGWNSWFVYGQRCRTLAPLADGTVRFTSELLIDGIFSWFADLTNGASLRAGMAAETAALAQRAESQP
jgi:hypothetical protein